jgi:K+ transporter
MDHRAAPLGPEVTVADNPPPSASRRFIGLTRGSIGVLCGDAAATVIACQAVITGAVSVTREAKGAGVPLLFGGTTVLMTFIWQRGTRLLGAKTRHLEIPLGMLVNSRMRAFPHVAPGTAIVLTNKPDWSGVPRWQDKLSMRLAKSVKGATVFFRMPTGRFVEVGTQVTG